jgi:hypothetical protein
VNLFNELEQGKTVHFKGEKISKSVEKEVMKKIVFLDL